MEFEFTSRLSQFFRRFVHFHLVKCEAELKESRELDENEYETKYESDDHFHYVMKAKSFGDWVFKITINCDPDNNGDITPDEAYLLIELYYKRIFIGSITPSKFDSDFYIKKYSMCECEEYLSELDGYCADCYPYVITQEDNCCVCYENEGIWIKLSCDHILHKICWKKTIGTKCPLCRKQESISIDYLKRI
jgi:hypothetical protein